MDNKFVRKILKDTDYIRTGGSDEELRCAEYLRERCEELGAKARIEDFDVQMAQIREAHLYADGIEVPCLGYLNCGSWDVEGKLLYLANTDRYSLSEVRGKIVLIETGITHDAFCDLFDNGAKGVITYSGDANNPDDTGIDQKELRGFVAEGRKLPAVHLNVREAVKLIENGTKKVRIVIDQEEWTGTSRNVVADLKGKRKETILLTAHYDSTPLSRGQYDNMTGCIGLLGVLDELKDKKLSYSLRFVFCGSEERGLLGSKAYAADHAKDLEDTVLNINLDMIGTTMGNFISVVSAEPELVGYISYFAMMKGFGMDAKQGVYSSDSTPMADAGVPSLSFARIAKTSIAPIHNIFDTAAVISEKQTVTDTKFIADFTCAMACAKIVPVGRKIPDNIKEELDYYLGRKRR